MIASVPLRQRVVALNLELVHIKFVLLPDFAIGSPYEDGAGAIYIYNGNRVGAINRPQRIEAKSISSSLRGFGISFAPRSIDLDKKINHNGNTKFIKESQLS